MSWFVFVYCVLFFIHFILYESEGKITAPPDGTMYTFLPGSTESITWTFDDDPSNVISRTWSFTSKARSGTFAILLVGNQPTKIDGVLPSFDIKTPATLTLNNVNNSYNGTYRLALDVKGGVLNEFISDVTVFIARKPTVILNCSNSILDIDDDFICECKGLGGSPPANVTWYKDGNPMQGKTGTEEQLLTLIKVDETDSGTYECVAESQPDPVYRDEYSIRLNVRVKPKDTSIELKPNPAILGQSFTITCSSRGFPEPSYKISHNGSYLSDAKTHTISNTRWSDAGVYECNAENRLGNDKDSEILKFAGKGPPVTTKEPSIPNTSEKSIPNGLGCDSCGTVVVWHIVVSLLSGIIVGILFSHIVSCSRYRWCRNRKPEQNSKPQRDGVDTTYQELDLTKINTEDNYQSLRGNAAASASNDVENDDEQSTYTQLSKTRDEEDNYQSLT